MAQVTLKNDGMKLVPEDDASRAIMEEFGYPEGFIREDSALLDFAKAVCNAGHQVALPKDYFSKRDRNIIDNRDNTKKVLSMLDHNLLVKLLKAARIDTTKKRSLKEMRKLVLRAIDKGIIDPPPLLEG